MVRLAHTAKGIIEAHLLHMGNDLLRHMRLNEFGLDVRLGDGKSTVVARDESPMVELDLNTRALEILVGSTLAAYA